MRIYFAARYDRREALRQYANQLTDAGVEVVSSWLYDTPDRQENWLSDAERDVRDLRNSEVIVSFLEPRGSSNIGGGRHWEAGAAWALGKINVIVGPEEEIIFHVLPQYAHFETWEAALQAILHVHYDYVKDQYTNEEYDSAV